MVLKVLGLLLVVGAAAAFGHVQAERYEGRCRELTAFLGAFTLLETEISYGRLSLPRALRAVAAKAQAPASAFLLRVVERLQGPNADLAAVWESALAESGSCLARADREAILMLGAVLGRGQEEEEIRNLEVCQASLRGQLGQAEAEARQKVRLWRMGGLLSGLAIALLLL